MTLDRVKPEEVKAFLCHAYPEAECKLLDTQTEVDAWIAEHQESLCLVYYRTLRDKQDVHPDYWEDDEDGNVYEQYMEARLVMSRDNRKATP